jgi:carbonic anhydrase
MPGIKILMDGYKRFYHKYFDKKPQIYDNLKRAQAPKTLVIACSDSRVDPAILMDCDPGTIFVVRNIANIVPPYENTFDSHHGTSAAIEYAVTVLKVKHIVVMGHSQCGGIRAFVNLNYSIPKEPSFITTWIKLLSPIKAFLPKRISKVQACAHCEKEGIKLSLNNLLTFPWIAQRVKTKKLHVHGWYFDIQSGKLHDYKFFRKEFREINLV